MHIDEGTIQAYLDGELDEESVSRVERHLADCGRCSELRDAVLQRNEGVSEWMQALAAGAEQHPSRMPSMKVEKRLLDKIRTEDTNVFSKMFRPQYRTAWIGFAVIAVLGLSLSFAPVRALANSFLNLFRVEQVTIIEINPEEIMSQLDDASMNLESLISEQVTIEGEGEPFEVPSQEQAGTKAGFEVRLPQGMNEEAAITVVPGGEAQFEIDLARIQAILDAIGRSDLTLPQILDGATISLEIPTNVTTRWGDCKFDPESARERGYDPDDPLTAPTPECTALIQMPSPKISGPPEIDLNEMGEIYLQLLGMDAEEAAQFARTVDWSSTFVFPIPRYQASYLKVEVDGVEGTVIMDTRGSGHGEYSTVVWVKDGILYSLAGPHNVQTITRLANSLK